MTCVAQHLSDIRLFTLSTLTCLQELNSKLCIICPKHKYKIALADGEGIYKAADPTEKTPVRRWYSKGIKQRVHTVTETNGDVYVKLSERPGWLESDFYQGEKGKLQREKAEAAEKESEEEKTSSAWRGSGVRHLSSAERVPEKDWTDEENHSCCLWDTSLGLEVKNIRARSV